MRETSEDQIYMENKIKNIIPPNSKVKIYWDDQPHNYSKENKTKIRNYIANKYGVDKNNVNVVYRPVKLTDKGETIEITGAGIDNIMDVNYQRALMKELIERDTKNVDFNRIVALDEIVNGDLNIDLETVQHKKWSLKWVLINNFLSFGENNYIPFSKLKGLNVVNSSPSNQGGKTTLTIDSIKFLLHGNTTKTDTNEQIFNTFSDKNELVVRGMIDIEGEETIIERKMRRTAKKDGGWTVVNKVNYYKLLPDGEEEELNEEDARQTTKKIKDSVGSEKDFEMLVLATEKNLDDLIGLTTTESSKVLTRLIGLEVLEMKEEAVRKRYNEFAKKKKSNEYDIITLSDEISKHKENVEQFEDLNLELDKKLKEAKKEIQTLKDKNDALFNSKQTIDVEISELNPESLEKSIADLTKKGLEIKEEMETIEKEIAEIGDINFDEDRHHELTNELSTKNTTKALNEAEIARLNKVVSDLIAGGICQSCNRKLDDVDNSEHIAKHELEINNLTKGLDKLKKEIEKITNELNGLNETKSLVDKKNKLELNRDRLEVEIGSYRNKIVNKKTDLKKYNLNLDAIDMNKKIDIDITKVKTDLSVEEHKKDEYISKIERIVLDIETNKNDVTKKEKLIETIKKEEEVDKIYKLYIELVGKKGISKLVLRSVLPIINSEVQRLLEDVVDFEIEIFINDKNDVQFLLIKDGVSKLLKSGSGFEKTASSLALRAVLGKMSTLPMPNFITFDEVLGKVAPDNIEKLKSLFDKIKDMYESVFFITHNDLVRDWGDNVITVVKQDNISRVTIK
jgi:DNA repair exonuclease SbcCD ATPase subunit